MNASSPWFRAFTALVYGFLLAPIVIVVVASLNDAASLAFPPSHLSLRWFHALFTSADFGEAAAISVAVAVATAVASLALGTTASYALSRHAIPGRLLVLQYLTSPLILPAIFVGLALLRLYSRLGVPASLASLVVGHTVVALPYSVRAMYAAFAAYDRTLDEAAATLGARPLRTFFKVTLPVVRPSVIAATTFAFAISFSNIMVSVFLIGPSTTTLPVRMYNYIEFSNDPTIAAIAAAIVFATFGAVWVLDRSVGLGGVFR
jgi:putative spermidine/putrescine transport system permease protein